MQVLVGASPLTVASLARMMAPGNSGTHTVKLVNASDGTDVAGGGVAITMSGGTVGQFQYGSLSQPVTLAAGTAYYVVSQETASGDNWYDSDTVLTTTGVAVDSAVVWGMDSGSWARFAEANHCYVPVNFNYTTIAPPSGNANMPGTAYVTGQVLGTVRNDYTGWLGMEVIVGASPLTVVSLGRIMAPGNNGTHTVKLVNASDGTDVAGGGVAISMSGGTVGQFQYGSLSEPVTLAAGTAYYVVSQETASGDSWYDGDTVLTTTEVAVDDAVVWGIEPGSWARFAEANHCYVPVSFEYY